MLERKAPLKEETNSIFCITFSKNPDKGIKKMFMKTGLAYLNLPRSGDISITLGETQGNKERQSHSPERGE